MKIFNKYQWILYVGMILSSCITTQSVPIDQMEPGKVNLPSTVRKVALISRNFKFSMDTLAKYYNSDFRLKKGSMTENLMIDSIAVTKSMDSLRKALLESGRFEEVFVYPSNAIKPHIADKELPFSTSFIQSLCTESETDAVISLEMLSFFYSRHNGSSGREIQPEANVKVTAIWSVYTPKSDGPIDRFTHSEVIRWSDKDPKVNSLNYKLPGRKEAISIACGVAAKNYSKRIVPYWAESSRIIIGLNGLDWEKAMYYAEKSEWKKAAQIWKKYLETPQTRVAGVAALNYAVAQEMLGDPDQASAWSAKSVSLLKSGETGRIARDYAGQLYQRKLKAVQLNSLLKISRP
ncbi:MAG TPA: DUF6340 family protein [Prolixibacteraceae bacterium]|nr:DUF6340 family protein [Prolixibacteraceae bacterium]